ncbi:MAG: hypothetical protein P4L40_15155 [Terracidiphilus sp.]|nr:hypothetical protein [Terracidiphilus sp.]
MCVGRGGGGGLCVVVPVCVPVCLHFLQYRVSYLSQAGSGWACGYRNIQMLCSGLLQHPVYKGVLFGGAGFVPEIAFLQAWLELAWRQGGDACVRVCVSVCV